jgi:tRNA (cmo5U34)-methyltransferase
MTNTDKLFSKQLNTIEDFSFDDQVADVFPDMIARSVPGYHDILKSIEQLAAVYAKPKQIVYDLGCSLGAASLAVAHGCLAPVEIKAYDNSPAMLSRCDRYIRQFSHSQTISLYENDVTDIEIENASMVIMNFTLQFIPPEKRKAMIDKIFRGLNPGGILVLSEKIKAPGQLANNLLIDLHHEFKRENGYSELEISQKRAALENVMQLDSFESHRERLDAAGFDDVAMYYKRFNFTSMVAIKA